MLAGKDVLAPVCNQPHLFKYRHRLPGQRNDMSPSSLHALGRYAPNPVVKIKLVPYGKAHLVRAAKSICREEKRHARNHVGVFVEIAHEPGDFRLRDEGREVLDLMHLDTRG